MVATSLGAIYQQGSLAGQAAGFSPTASLAATSPFGSLAATAAGAASNAFGTFGAGYQPPNQIAPPAAAFGSLGRDNRALDALSSLATPTDNPFGHTPFGQTATGPSAFDAFGQREALGKLADAFSSPDTPLSGSPFGLDRSLAGSQNPMARFYDQALTNMQKMAQQWGFGATGAALGSALPGAASGAVGQVGTGIGQFDAGADADIARAAADHGVPANFLKAIVARESSGDWNDNAHWVNSVRGGARIYGYVGVFEDAARSWGFDFDSLNGNRLGQLEMLATGLRNFYDQSPGHDWLQAASMHFSGNWGGNYTDELGNTTSGYVGDIANWWRQLDASVGQQTNTGAAPGGGSPVASGGMNAITGGQSYPVTQEFGPTDWSMGAGSYMYGYGADYGVQGHPGVDVGTPRGTQLYSPVGGTVQIAGGQPYYTFYGNGSPGVGELLIQLDNGDQLILGHMEQITAQVGQRVQPGQYVGLSGGDNGDHVHVEYRRLGGNTSSGYTAVDPRQALGGAFVSSFGGGNQAAPQQPQSPLWWLNLY